MTLYTLHATTFRAANAWRVLSKPDNLPSAILSGQVSRSQLATEAARIIRHKLQADFVWIGEIASLRRIPLACRDDDAGFGAPPVTVLAAEPGGNETLPGFAQPVLPASLAQIAWDAAQTGESVEMNLRTPARALIAVPVALQSGSWFVLIVGARPHTSTPVTTRRLLWLAASAALALDILAETTRQREHDAE